MTISPGDTFVATKLDRIARSVSDGITLLNLFFDMGVKVHILNIGIIDDTPTGHLTRNILLSFAEFERELILERTREGKEIARRKAGFRDGRPPKYSVEQIQHAIDLLFNYSYKQVSQMTGISVSTLVRYRAKAVYKKRTGNIISVDSLHEIQRPF